jgi:PIN domain nuclease of toxin-antitoxin system
MRVLLDTCAILWSILEPEHLGKEATEILTSETTEVVVSSISCAERSRIALDRHWKLWFRHFTRLNGWQVLDIGLSQVEEAYSLPEYTNRDPADRIISATARLLQCPIVTADTRMRGYPPARFRSIFSQEAIMTFAERMKEMIDKGVAGSRDIAMKASEKAKELGSKGVIKIEILQFESQAEKLIAKLGAEVYASLVERNGASVGRDAPAISSLLKELEGLRASIEKKEKEYAAIGG